MKKRDGRKKENLLCFFLFKVIIQGEVLLLAFAVTRVMGNKHHKSQRGRGGPALAMSATRRTL